MQRCDGCFVYGMADDDDDDGGSAVLLMLHMSMVSSPASYKDGMQYGTHTHTNGRAAFDSVLSNADMMMHFYCPMWIMTSIYRFYDVECRRQY